MAYVKKIEGVDFVFGLKWTILGLVDGVSISKEKVVRIKQEGLEYGIAYNYDEITCLGLIGRAFKGNVIAARTAALMVKPDVPTIFHIELDDDMFWFVAIAGGAVVQGTDIVGDHETVDEAMADFDGIEDYEMVTSLDFEPEHIARAKKEFKVKKLTVNIKAMVVALILLAAAGVGYMQYKSAQEAKERAELIKLQEMARLNATTVEEIKKVDDKSLIKRFTTRVDAALFIDAAVSMYAKHGGIHKGWELEKIACDLHGCYLDYIGRPYARFTDIPKIASFNPGSKAYSLVESLPKDIPLVKGVDEAPLCSVFAKETSGVFAESKYLKGKFSEPKRKDTGMTNFDAISKLKYGSFHVSGIYFDMMREFMLPFLGYSNIKLTNISIQKSNTWTVQGEFLCTE